MTDKTTQPDPSPHMPNQPTDPLAVPPTDDGPPSPSAAHSKSQGGRPSNAQLAAELAALGEDNARLRDALLPFSEIPEQPDREGTFVVYTLTRCGRSHQILAGQIRKAQRALGR